MSFPWAPALLALYYSVLAVLSFYGLHRLWMVLLYLRTRADLVPMPAPPTDPEDRKSVV